ncbi:hypothetical protein D3C80_1854390 [compost metagenome]
MTVLALAVVGMGDLPADEALHLGRRDRLDVLAGRLHLAVQGADLVQRDAGPTERWQGIHQLR